MTFTFTTFVIALALGIGLGEFLQSFLIALLNLGIYKFTAKRRAAAEAAEKEQLEQFRKDLLFRAQTVGAARQEAEGPYTVN
jgi:hypothetical protein